MISIENLYWVIFKNLLEPTGLDCWYYVPFGSTQNLSQFEFKPWQPKEEHHVLFHFDQEPLWSDDFGIYDTRPAAWRTRIARILANSEISQYKKEICKHRQMLDWYFFFHGFAALDWFRDCEFIDFDAKPSRVFCSHNHLVTDLRAYRMAITARLARQDILRFGDISFHGTAEACKAELKNPDSWLSDLDKEIIRKHLLNNQYRPMLLDGARNHMDFSARLGHAEYDLWQRSLVHLVNETVFYHPKLHLTEKIFKPIVAQRPFILAAAPDNLAYLKKYGFQTFDRWWDESYDHEQDPNERMQMIVDVLVKLCEKSPGDLAKMHEEMKPVIQFNRRHFFGHFRHMIVDEMIDNFDTCIRSWNHGRVDGRGLSMLPDLGSVKNLLKS